MCKMAKCHTFYQGRLYRCPRGAHGEQQGVFMHKDNEVVDFNIIEDKIEKQKSLEKC